MPNSGENSFWCFLYLVLVNSTHHWQGHIWGTVCREQRPWREFSDGPWWCSRDWSISPMRKGWESWACLAQTNWWGELINVHKHLSEGCKKDRARIVSVLPSHGTRGTLGHPAQAVELEKMISRATFPEVSMLCSVFGNISLLSVEQK